MKKLFVAAAMTLLASQAFATDQITPNADNEPIPEDVIVTPEERMTLAEDPLPDGAVTDENGEFATIETQGKKGSYGFYRRGYACLWRSGSGKGYYGRHYTKSGAFWGGYRGCGYGRCSFGGCYRHGWWGWTGLGWRYGWFGPRWGWGY